jgi:hypothetical protein
MTALQPWAWLGLLALAVPVAIHLLTRAEPRPQLFPTLRFLTTATTTAIRRRHLRDRLLLVLRMAILASVVAALAQPWFPRATTPDGTAPIRRAVVIDTSASMARPVPTGRSALDVARDEANHVAPTAAATVSIEAVHLPDGLSRAATWLAHGGGRPEIVVLSDFQRGALSRVDVDRVPAGLGLRLLKIEVPAPTAVDGASSRIGDRVWTPHLTLEPDRTTVAWSTRAPASPDALETAGPGPLEIVAGPEEAGFVRTATGAARLFGRPEPTDPHPVAVVLPGASDRTRLLAEARPLDQPWMFTRANRLRDDATLEAAVARATALPGTLGSASTVLARDQAGAPVVAVASRSGTDLLLIAQIGHETADDALVLGALLTGVARSAVDPAALAELEPVTVGSADLATWERPTPPGGPLTVSSTEQSDGRWFWILALALLALEGWWRRPAPVRPASEVPHARVA